MRIWWALAPPCPTSPSKSRAAIPRLSPPPWTPPPARPSSRPTRTSAAR